MAHLRAVLMTRPRLTVSTAFAGVLLTLCGAVPTASALPPIRECGDFVPTGIAHGVWTGYWSFHPAPGFTPIYNLTTRVVRCPYARQFSFHMDRHWRKRHYQGFTCQVHVYYELIDERCTNGGKVIHWHGGD